MSALHLEKGSKQPPTVDGKLRLYSMQFCPFSQRVRMVLLIKGIPHDIVNVHLRNKPKWLFDLHPEGRVPALDTGSQIITESLDISNYLDEQYPEPPLYPKDQEKREQDEAFIHEFGGLLALYYKALYTPGNTPYAEHIRNMIPHVEKLERDLRKRGVYFGGDEPNMVDYMIWPWAERADALGQFFNQELPGASVLPHLYSWCKLMRSQKPVQQTETSTERTYKLFVQHKETPNAVNYDIV